WRITNARTSATARYSSTGMTIPTRACFMSAIASGRFSTIGMPFSSASFLMRSATLRWPIARTIGAGALDGSYLSAIARCVGLTITTSALGTSLSICLRAIARPIERMRCLSNGSPSEFLNSCLISALLMRISFENCQYCGHDELDRVVRDDLQQRDRRLLSGDDDCVDRVAPECCVNRESNDDEL